MSKDFSTVDMNSKTLVTTISDDASVFVSDNGRLLRMPIKSFGGNMNYCGEVSALPEEANKGDVYKVTAESGETGKLLITVSGVNSIVQNPVYPGSDFTGYSQYDIDRSAAISEFLAYAYDGMYGEYGESFNSYIESGGKKYNVPWITTQSFGDESDDFLVSTNEALEALFVNGKSLVCYSTDMSHLPESLKQYVIKYPAETCFVYRDSKWSALDADVITELAVRVKQLEAETSGKADTSLENVSNENFKAKANAAGIGGGGTSGAMVFKGVVDTLPDTANNGEVYVNSSWKKKGTYSNVSMNLNSNGISFSEWNSLADFLYSDVQSNYGCSYKLVVDGSTYVYTDCSINSAGDWGFDMSGSTNDISSSVPVFGAAVEVYYAPSGKSTEKKTCIYHNGEWIEL